MNYFDEFVKILREKCNITSEIKPETKISDFNLDSLDFVEVIMEAEQSHDIVFTDDELRNLTTVQSVVDKIIEKENNK